ncbi:MAG: SurA N-terminal domain-containing protein, partial [Proteobacteria bacterium]|nr:SurA N-terminal domain-containing protein [Pseudomonadota bacterium]
MLQIFRDKAQSTFIQAIVLVIALVFIFWGVGTNMMSNREAAIVVNDEEISFQDYQKVY